MLKYPLLTASALTVTRLFRSNFLGPLSNFPFNKGQFFLFDIQKKQGRIHSPPVADGWAGAEERKNAHILFWLRMDGPTDRPTDIAASRVAFTRLKSHVEQRGTIVFSSVL